MVGRLYTLSRETCREHKEEKDRGDIVVCKSSVIGVGFPACLGATPDGKKVVLS